MEFVQFRVLSGKKIEGDISFGVKKNFPSLLTSERLGALGLFGIS
jgi:hypothetical protein